MKKNQKNGFTLVELLAIILVIAVPKVMSVIEDKKKATLESTASQVYLEKKGISAQYTGKNYCVESGDYFGYCNDGVERTTNWTGLVRLKSAADVMYASEWLNGAWTITSYVHMDQADYIAGVAYLNCYGMSATSLEFVSPSVYLNSNIKVISGNGDTEPYVLAM